MPPSDRPAIGGIHHFSPTVSDVAVSAARYCEVFGLVRLDRVAPHYGDEAGGFAVLLVEPEGAFMIGLHHHEAGLDARFDERRVGLNHLAWTVPTRLELDRWHRWLDGIGVASSGVIDVTGPSPYSVIVFRDPDNIELALFHR